MPPNTKQKPISSHFSMPPVSVLPPRPSFRPSRLDILRHGPASLPNSSANIYPDPSHPSKATSTNNIRMCGPPNPNRRPNILSDASTNVPTPFFPTSSKIAQTVKWYEPLVSTFKRTYSIAAYVPHCKNWTMKPLSHYNMPCARKKLTTNSSLPMSIVATLPSEQFEPSRIILSLAFAALT
jgi:hypothetical protein